MTEVIQLTRKDFVSDQTVRWCPGCGDYAILAQMQKVLPELGIAKENIVFISGIGCSSRFPYYMNTYGIHSIHGRAPTLATGLKIANPNLSVWVITGDGDGLSIGGNHFLHSLRRNVDINIILFNNRIYGLTKGQYSPTSPQGKITKSSPMGTLERPLNPMSVAIAAEATFVARTIDTNVKHMAEVFKRAAEHKGTSFVEIYQNCVIFNDKAFGYATDSQTRDDTVLALEHGQPMIFGKDRDKGIRVRGLDLEIVPVADVPVQELLKHDEFGTASRAYLLSRMRYPEFPEPIGVFRQLEGPTYEAGVLAQISQTRAKKGPGNLHKLYHAAETWEVFPESEPAPNGHEHRRLPNELGPSEFDEEYTGVVFYGEGAADASKRVSLLTATLADLKPKKPLTASVDISAAEAVARLKAKNVGFMALVDAAGKLVGVFTEGDVFAKIACKFENLENMPVSEFMTTPVTALKPDSKIAYALHLMSLHNFRHIPIVDDQGRPKGVISFRSVVSFLENNFAANGEN
jgi:2-oxoglutarate ferredoxin oxidoreductase subunit beta